MSVAIKKIEGVERVNVSLNEGMARIRLKPGNKVTLEQLRQAVKDNGFTPKDARVTAHGKITSTGGKLQLNVSGTNQVYQLSIAPKAKKSKNDLQAELGKTLLVEGVIGAADARKGSPTLQVTNFTPTTEKGS